MTPTFYTRFGKRLLDLFLSFVGLVLLSPFLLLIALAVRLSSRGPALFRQVRTGRFEKPFRILKFRTMRINSSGPSVTAAGDSRITPLGRWLRKTKIDELPQLFNVLVGHMSLVGPRPEVPLYTARYSSQQRQVFTTKPGITSPSIIIDEEKLLASRQDREAAYVSTILPAKLRMDLDYCKNVRFVTDVRTILGTLMQLGTNLVNVFALGRAAAEIQSGNFRDNSTRQTLP